MDRDLHSNVDFESVMIFSAEPDLDVPGIATSRHCNKIIVTEDGCDVDSCLLRFIVCSYSIG